MLLSKLPGTYVNLLIETIEEWGISSEEILADTTFKALIAEVRRGLGS
ncbi:hypothetical protein [Acinetobacter junii]|nr:hypothetical protein [Acinetobacter junii]